MALNLHQYLDMRRKIQRYCLTGIILLGISIASGCEQEADIKQVRLTPTQEDYDRARKSQERFRFAIGAVVSPERTFSTYNEFVRFVGQRLGQQHEMVQRKTYAEMNELLYMNNVDAGLICTGAYVDGHDKFGIEALVVPVCYGEPVYYSYIITPRDSLVQDFEQLRGKRFAFTDPLSNSGYFYPMYLLAAKNESPDSFFGEYIFTYSHDNSIKAVMEGLVDAAAVDSLIYDYDVAVEKEVVERTKIINKSPAFCINPVVVPANTDERFRRKLKTILLSMHQVPEGQEILERLKIEKFIEVDDSQYDFSREMRRIVQGGDPAHAEVMVIFQQKVGKIIEGLSTDDMKKIEVASQGLEDLYYKYDIDNENSGLDKDAYANHKQEFDLLDGKFHSTAAELSEDARRGDKAKLIEDFREIMNTCIACHDRFRTKETTKALTASTHADNVEETGAVDTFE